jgi:predicted double-glycine peptidase
MLCFLYISYPLFQTIPKETLKFLYVHEQEFDSSCGFSSVSSLLNIYWGIYTSEKQIIDIVYTPNKGDVKNYTSTLAALAEIISSYNLANASFKMNFSELKKVTEKFPPVLVHYSKPHNHFALVLCIIENGVVVADPLEGIELIHFRKFTNRWSGIVLITDSITIKRKNDVLEQAIKLIKNKQELFNKWTW